MGREWLPLADQMREMVRDAYLELSPTDRWAMIVISAFVVANCWEAARRVSEEERLFPDSMFLEIGEKMLVETVESVVSGFLGDGNADELMEAVFRLTEAVKRAEEERSLQT